MSTEQITDFTKPTQPTDVEQAFGAAQFTPPLDIIPTTFEYQDFWKEVFNQWFFHGLNEGTAFVAKPGIDAQVAGAHVQTVMTSWAFKHEHKELAATWLMSLWFEDCKLVRDE